MGKCRVGGGGGGGGVDSEIVGVYKFFLGWIRVIYEFWRV